MKLQFYFEFASTYSYLSSSRIESQAKANNLTVEYKPFLLGPIFKDQGWNDSPFNIYPAKGNYMWRDLARQSAKYDLNFRKPTQFPRNGLRAARLTLAAINASWLPGFVRRVYQANFEEDRNIAEEAVLIDILKEFTEDVSELIKNSKSQQIKDLLRANTEKARQLQIFGAPSFVIGEEMFWGDDRLEDAIQFALKKSISGV